MADTVSTASHRPKSQDTSETTGEAGSEGEKRRGLGIGLRED